jgi:hypothetical protein
MELFGWPDPDGRGFEPVDCGFSGSGCGLEAPFIPFLWGMGGAGLGFLAYVALPDGPSCLAGAGLFLLKESGTSSSSSSSAAYMAAGLTAAIAY